MCIFQISLVCKASKVSMEYFVGCNYFWLLVEAIFLHTLLFTAVLTRKRLLRKYMIIGWGEACFYYIKILFTFYLLSKYVIHLNMTYSFSDFIQWTLSGTPSLFVFPWTVAKVLYEDKRYVPVLLLIHTLKSFVCNTSNLLGEEVFYGGIHALGNDVHLGLTLKLIAVIN